MKSIISHLDVFFLIGLIAAVLCCPASASAENANATPVSNVCHHDHIMWCMGTMPTCTEMGTVDMICADCHVKQQSLPVMPLGHVEGEKDTRIECRKEKNCQVEYTLCSVCDQTMAVELISVET